MSKSIAWASALVLLAISHAPATKAAEQSLKFKLASFYVGEKEASRHFQGIAVLSDGSLGTEENFDTAGENGASAGHTVYNFPLGSLELTYSAAGAGTKTGGHFKGKYQIVSGAGAYQGATGSGGFEGDWGDKSPLKGAALTDVELYIRTP